MKKLGVFLLSIFLLLVCATFIVINGKTYTVRIKNINSNYNVSDFKVNIDNGNVKLISKKLDGDTLKLKFKSISVGKSFIEVNSGSENVHYAFSLYVHKFGIITFDSYFGDCTGGIIIPISCIIALAFVLFLLIRFYRKSIKENIYQYKNISCLGLIIFLTFSLFNQVATLISYKYTGPIQTIKEIITMCSFFSHVLLPLALISFVLVSISNIVLIKKEGFRFTNLLGILMGLCLCVGSVFPDILNDYLQSVTWVDVHNERGIALYVLSFVELYTYMCVSYLECVLLGTIILGIKTARKIPKFDKDYILILGCQIKKDGTLTNLLRERVDKALLFRNMQLENTGKDLIFVPSGGKGNDEIISESQAMKNYLLEKGIDDNKILLEDRSKNTFENIKFSARVIKKKRSNIAFSTTNYHVFRAGIIATSQNIIMEGIGAKTKSYFWINAFIREYIATLFSRKTTHKIVMLNFIISALIMVALVYLSNVI